MSFKIEFTGELYRSFLIMDIVNILMEYHNWLPLISFTLLMLAALNIPISEDIVMIVSGAMAAATSTLEYTIVVIIACFLGAYLGDIMAYCIGRFPLSKIVAKKDNMGFIGKLISVEKLEKAEKYFATYGKKTLFFARFIPFGVRNITFMASGLLKMRLRTFMIIDVMALLLCMSITFSLGYIFSSNFEKIFPYLNKYKLFILLGVISVITFILLKKTIKTYRANRKEVKDIS